MKVASFLLLTLTFFFFYSAVVVKARRINCDGFPKRACTKEYNPHCASDGKTYENKCIYCNAYVASGRTLRLRYCGECYKI